MPWQLNQPRCACTTLNNRRLLTCLSRACNNAAAGARTRLASESSESDRCKRCDRGCSSAGLGAALSSSSSSRLPPANRRTGDDVASSSAVFGDVSRLLHHKHEHHKQRMGQSAGVLQSPVL